MIKAFKIALNPSWEQEKQFESHAGAARYCFNKVLGYAIDTYKADKEGAKFPSHQNLRRAWYDNRDLWAVNRDDGSIWWSENSKQVYDMACRNAAGAYKNFFQGRAKFPRFKKKGVRDSFQFAEQVKLIGYHHIQLPKIGQVKTHESLRKLIEANPQKIGTATVSKDSSGRWFISLVIHLEEQAYTVPVGKTVGIDLGLKTLAVIADEDGNVLWEEPNNKHLRGAQIRLRRAQKALSRSQRNSNRRDKKKARVGKLHSRVRNLRR